MLMQGIAGRARRFLRLEPSGMRPVGLVVCLSVALTALAVGIVSNPPHAHADPFDVLQFGTADENVEKAEKDAQKAIDLLGINLSVEDADILKIGSSYAVDDGETVKGDVVIVGGALTVEGKIDGDAVVIGGSMYLASTSVVTGDAVVMGGILEKEDGAIVGGKIFENPQEAIDLEGIEGVEGVPTEPVEPLTPHEIEGGPGDVVRTGEDVYIAEDQEVTGDVVVTGGNITVDGTVDGDVVATSGDVNLGSSAHVKGDAVSVFGDIKLADGAVVDGDVVKIGMGSPEVLRSGKEATREAREEEGMEVAPAPAGKEEKGRTVRYRISLSAPDAKDVRLTGDFINWDPEGIRMTVDDKGTWSTYYDFPEGTSLYKLIVDGKAIPDPDEPDKQVEDGMGGYATQLVAIPKSSNAVPIRFSLYRPDAEDVRVTGTFNNWDQQGIKMTKDEKGTWSVTVPIEPGPVLYQFYIDGEWGPDPDVAEKVDDGRGDGLLATPFTIKPPRPSFTLKAGQVAEKEGTNVTPGIDYNRVDGLYLAIIGSNKTNVFPLPRFYLEGGHSWKRDRWLYTVEIEQPVLAPIMVSVGGSFYDKTDTNDRELISDGENFISSAFVKRDYRDYFDRRGVTGFVALRPMESHTVRVSYMSDDYRPLSTRAHAAIFRHDDDFAANPHNPAIPPDEVLHNPPNIYQIGADPITGLQVIDKISLRSMEVSYEFDSRDNDKAPSSGLWARLSGEWAGRDFGGTYDYSRYWADVRFYQQITSKQKYAVRAKVGGLVIPEHAHCANLPGPENFFPKQFFVGGIGTMPGYDYKEFRGTHMILMNAEYFMSMKGGCGLVFFADGGDARGKGEHTSDVFEAMKIRYDAGVGIRCESAGSHVFTIGVAKRLDDTDEPVLVTMRASRPF